MKSFLLLVVSLVAITLGSPSSLDFRKLRSSIYPPTQVPELASWSSDASPRVAKVAIVTGIFEKNSPSALLASSLAAKGHKVTVYVNEECDVINEAYEIVQIVQEDLMVYSLEYTASLAVYHQLKEHEYDVIHFNSHLAFVSLQAKRAAEDFGSSAIVLSVEAALDTEIPSDSPLATLVTSYMDRRSFELADAVYTSDKSFLESRAILGFKFNTVYGLDTTAATSFISTFQVEPVEEPTETPLVSVVVPTFNRPTLLLETVVSIDAQDYSNIELVVVDDGSTLAGAQDALVTLERRPNTVVVRQSNKFLGAARNRGAQEAHGKYILFLDDDNIATTDMVSTLVRASLLAESDIAVNAHSIWKFDTNQEESGVWYPLGPAPLPGIFTNVFGNANFMIKRSSFLGLDGFTTDRLGAEDHEFHAKASLAGLSYAVVPRPLMYYRMHENGNQMFLEMDKEAAYERALRAYANVIDPEDKAALADRKRGGTPPTQCYILGFEQTTCGADAVLSGRVFVQQFGARKRQIVATVQNYTEAGLPLGSFPNIFLNGETTGATRLNFMEVVDAEGNPQGFQGSLEVVTGQSSGSLTFELNFNVNGVEIPCKDASGNEILDIKLDNSKCCCYASTAVKGDTCVAQADAAQCKADGNTCWEADLDADGDIDVSDLATFLTLWGPCQCDPCIGDFYKDQFVKIEDLVELLVQFGPSTEYVPPKEPTCCCILASDPTICIPLTLVSKCTTSASFTGCRV